MTPSYPVTDGLLFSLTLLQVPGRNVFVRHDPSIHQQVQNPKLKTWPDKSFQTKPLLKRDLLLSDEVCQCISSEVLFKVMRSVPILNHEVCQFISNEIFSQLRGLVNVLSDEQILKHEVFQCSR